MFGRRKPNESEAKEALANTIRQAVQSARNVGLSQRAIANVVACCADEAMSPIVKLQAAKSTELVAMMTRKSS
jgi:hypothetical protein